MQMRFSCGRQVAWVDEEGGRVVFLDTSFTAEFDDGLRIRGRLAADGSTEPEGIGLQDLTITMTPDAPIRPQRLREVPWGEMLAAALDYGAVPIGNAGPVKGRDMGRRRSGPRRRLDDAHYSEVADLYREAIRTKRPVRRYIADRLNCSEESAKAYIRTARERGLLGPAPAKGAKGEAK